MLNLYDYQQKGVAFLVSNKGGMLLDEQGLGKTIQAIETCNRTEATFVCVVCPAIMRGTWKAELKEHCNKDFFVESYEIYSKNYVKILKDLVKKDKIIFIIDESHYIKTPTSKRAKTILNLLNLDNVVSKILLTGTPITRDVDDLYTQLSVFYRYENFWFRNIWQFRKNLMKCKHDFFGDTYTGYKDDNAKNMLQGLLKKVAIRRTKSQVALELPSIIREKIFVDINKKVAKDSLKYVDLATQIITGDKTFTDFKDKTEEEATHIASIRKALGIAKIPRIVEFVSMQVESNIKKMIVFCVHTDVIDMLEKALQEKHKDYIIHTIKGSTSNAKRQRIIDQFQNYNLPQIIVANIVASGVGVTLTKSHTIIFGEIDWTPANMLQAEARVHRITQTQAVNSYFLLANESLDSRIVDILFNKLKIIKGVL